MNLIDCAAKYYYVGQPVMCMLDEKNGQIKITAGRVKVMERAHMAPHHRPMKQVVDFLFRSFIFSFG